MAASLQCGASTIKYLLFFFSVVLVLCGVVLIALGAVALRSEAAAASSYNAGLGLIIAVGVIIFLVAFLGCCGAIQQNRFMLYGFTACLLLIILLQLIGVILVLKYYNDDFLAFQLQKIFYRARMTSNADDVATRDAIQTSFSCCGFASSLEYLSSGLPASCCETLQSSACVPQYVFQANCLSQVSDFTSRFGNAIGGVGVAALLIEIAGVALSYYLAKQL